MRKISLTFDIYCIGLYFLFSSVTREHFVVPNDHEINILDFSIHYAVRMCNTLYFCQNADNLFYLYEFISRSKTDPITGAVKNTKYHQL